MLLRVRWATDSNAEGTGGGQVGQKGRISVSGAVGISEARRAGAGGAPAG
jgi:hypothetical protein